jgi:hypothetical protein
MPPDQPIQHYDHLRVYQDVIEHRESYVQIQGSPLPGLQTTWSAASTFLSRPRSNTNAAWGISDCTEQGR